MRIWATNHEGMGSMLCLFAQMFACVHSYVSVQSCVHAPMSHRPHLSATLGNTKTLRMTSESETNVHQQVPQEVMVTPLLQQLGVLMSLIRKEMMQSQFKIIVFFATARMTQCMAEIFNCSGIEVLEIHSRKSQKHRSNVSDKFRDGIPFEFRASSVICSLCIWEGWARSAHAHVLAGPGPLAPTATAAGSNYGTRSPTIVVCLRRNI